MLIQFNSIHCSLFTYLAQNHTFVLLNTLHKCLIYNNSAKFQFVWTKKLKKKKKKEVNFSCNRQKLWQKHDGKSQ